jgi:hypothetical protein
VPRLNISVSINDTVCVIRFLSCVDRRGLNPPHRVKSISMATFTSEEIDFVRCRGNEVQHSMS